MPHIPEDEEPPGEPQAVQTQVSAPSCPWLAWLGAKLSILGRGHRFQTGHRVLGQRGKLQGCLGKVRGFCSGEYAALGLFKWPWSHEARVWSHLDRI